MKTYKMTKIIIVDDEARARNILRILIERNLTGIEIRTAESGAKALELIKEDIPDLIFLDIQMPFMNGFEFLEQLTERPFETIFTTAFDEYAIKAIRFAALDYLLKPIQESQLKEAYSRFQNKKTKEASLKLQYQNLLHNLQLPNHGVPQLTVASLEETRLIPITQIIRCEASSNYTKIYLQDESSILASKTLKEYEAILSSTGFLRVHKSHLVNAFFIERIVNKSELILSNNDRIPISRRRKELINNWLQQSSQKE